MTYILIIHAVLHVLADVTIGTWMEKKEYNYLVASSKRDQLGAQARKVTQNYFINHYEGEYFWENLLKLENVLGGVTAYGKELGVRYISLESRKRIQH